MRFDSIEALPNEKGKVEFSYRKENAQLLSQLYGNLYTGGVFLLNHRKYKEAVQHVDTYLMAPEWPIMEGSLKWGKFVELVENFLGEGILFKLWKLLYK